MSDSQRFPVAAHTLAYLAHKGAFDAAAAAPSSVLAASIPTNPVVIRRVTAMLARAGLIATRDGIAVERRERNPYVNIIAVHERDRAAPWVAALLRAYQSEPVRQFIVSRYQGSVLPAF